MIRNKLTQEYYIVGRNTWRAGVGKVYVKKHHATAAIALHDSFKWKSSEVEIVKFNLVITEVI